MTTMRIVLLSAVLGACGGGGKPAPATAGSAVSAPALPPGITVEGTGDNSIAMAVSAARAAVTKLSQPKHAFVVTVTEVTVDPGDNTACKIQLSIADAKRDVFGFANSAASTKGADEAAQKVCIETLTSELVATQVAKSVAEHDQ